MIKRFLVFSFWFLAVALVLAFGSKVYAESASSSSAQVKFPITIDGVGSCNTKDECKKLCDTAANHQNCTKWFKQQPFYRKPAIQEHKEEIIASAKDKLGCDSVETCKASCQKAENKQVCAEIYLTVRALYKDEKIVVHDAQKFKVELEKVRKDLQNPEDIKKLIPGFSQLEGEKKQINIGGQTCQNTACIKQVCDKPENKQECSDLAKKFGLRGGMQGEQKSNIQNQNNLPPGCTSVEQCKRECLQSPDICKARMNYQQSPGGTPKPGGQYPEPQIKPQTGGGTSPAPQSTVIPNISNTSQTGQGAASPVPSTANGAVQGVSVVSGFFQQFFGFLFGF